MKRLKLNRILNVLLCTVLFCCIGVLVYIHLSGLKLFSVASGSMEPAVQTGSLIVNQKKQFNAIEEGDIITYKISNSDIYVTHRVIEVDKKNQRVLCKGDANMDSDDAFITSSQYQGHVILTIPYAGYITMFMQSFWGMIVCGIIIIGLLISIIYDLYQVRKEKKVQTVKID